MARLMTIGYGDQAGYDRTDPAVRDAAHAHDARLRAAGMESGIAGPAVQVRNHGAEGVRRRRGAAVARRAVRRTTQSISP